MDDVTGSCRCGATRFVTSRPPLRAGLCHCRDCQQFHGAAYNPFIVYPRDAVRLSGPVRLWRGGMDYERLSCTTCGSSMGGLTNSEIELSAGTFDHGAPIDPQYESWVIRRMRWVKPLDLPQYERGRD
jgi:hypothetical protein